MATATWDALSRIGITTLAGALFGAVLKFLGDLELPIKSTTDRIWALFDDLFEVGAPDLGGSADDVVAAVFPGTAGAVIGAGNAANNVFGNGPLSNCPNAPI